THRIGAFLRQQLIRIRIAARIGVAFDADRLAAILVHETDELAEARLGFGPQRRLSGREGDIVERHLHAFRAARRPQVLQASAQIRGGGLGEFGFFACELGFLGLRVGDALGLRRLRTRSFGSLCVLFALRTRSFGLGAQTLGLLGLGEALYALLLGLEPGLLGVAAARFHE